MHASCPDQKVDFLNGMRGFTTTGRTAVSKALRMRSFWVLKPALTRTPAQLIVPAFWNSWADFRKMSLVVKMHMWQARLCLPGTKCITWQTQKLSTRTITVLRKNSGDTLILWYFMGVRAGLMSVLVLLPEKVAGLFQVK